VCPQNIRGGICVVHCYKEGKDALGKKSFSYNMSSATEGQVAIVTLLTAPIAAARCVATGAGIVGPVTAGAGAKFQVQARDMWGNDRTLGGDTFRVEAKTKATHTICSKWKDGKPGSVCQSAYSGKVTLYGIVTDNSFVAGKPGGTYHVHYNATVSGGYDVVVALQKGENTVGINQSPVSHCTRSNQRF
jgi:hypothetical protein